MKRDDDDNVYFIGEAWRLNEVTHVHSWCLMNNTLGTQKLGKLDKMTEVVDGRAWDESKCG